MNILCTLGWFYDNWYDIVQETVLQLCCYLEQTSVRTINQCTGLPLVDVAAPSLEVFFVFVFLKNPIGQPFV